eukprot:365057-Pyramimonas_sp.AAC.1
MLQEFFLDRQRGCCAELPRMLLGVSSGALDSVSVARQKFQGGHFKALVMTETPRQLLLGERRMDRGRSIYWPAREATHALLPGGRRVDLKVVGEMPCRTLSRREALRRLSCAVARERLLSRGGVARCRSPRIFWIT